MTDYKSEIRLCFDYFARKHGVLFLSRISSRGATKSRTPVDDDGRLSLLSILQWTEVEGEVRALMVAEAIIKQ